MARPGAAQERVAVKLGLGPTEAVLRGGALSQPTIVSQVVSAGGQQWLRLRKSDKELVSFLVRGDGGKSGKKVAISTSNLFAHIAAVRDEAESQMMLKALAEGEEAPDQSDQSDLLGLDAAPHAATPPKTPRKQLRVQAQQVREQMPALLRIELPTGDGRKPWAFNVLTGVNRSGRGAPACIELTEHNMKMLFLTFEAERSGSLRLELPTGEQLASGKRKTARAARAPRGEAGAREYWDGRKRRWVLQEVVAAGVRPKYRKVVRRPSDEQKASQPAALVAASEAHLGLLTGGFDAVADGAVLPLRGGG